MKKRKTYPKTTIILTLLNFLFVAILATITIFTMALLRATGWGEIPTKVRIIVITLSLVIIPLTSISIYILSFMNIFRERKRRWPIIASKIILIVPSLVVIIHFLFLLLMLFVASAVPADPQINILLFFLTATLPILEAIFIIPLNGDSSKRKRIAAQVSAALIFILAHYTLYNFVI